MLSSAVLASAQDRGDVLAEAVGGTGVAQL